MSESKQKDSLATETIHANNEAAIIAPQKENLSQEQKGTLTRLKELSASYLSTPVVLLAIQFGIPSAVHLFQKYEEVQNIESAITESAEILDKNKPDKRKMRYIEDRLGHYAPDFSSPEISATEDKLERALIAQKEYSFFKLPKYESEKTDDVSDHESKTSVENKDDIEFKIIGNPRSNFRKPNQELGITATESAFYSLLPTGWKENIDYIHFAYDEWKFPEKYGIRGHAVATADKSNNYNRGITFHQDALSISFKSQICDTGVHEAAHLNHWDNQKLPIDERVDMLYQVLLRLEQPNRYKSSYVESINNKDLKLQTYFKATEYYAEISEAYVNGDPNLHYLDSEIVANQMREGKNKNYDPDFARQKCVSAIK